MKFEKRLPLFLLLLFSLVLGYFVWASEGFHGGGDSLAHYRLAKFSWEHPIYLLDHWGKPFFTLLALPFAAFGFKGIQFFNLLCGFLSSIAVLAIAKELKLNYRWVAVPIVIATPIFMQEFFSGLTEVCFAMLLLFSLWLRLKKQFAFSLVLMSLLPFVRTEAVLLLIWFAALDLYERRSSQTVLLVFGTVIYSFIGWVVKGDLFWLVSEMPYAGGDHIYGSGSIFHYVQIMPEKIGRITLLAAGLGIAILSVGVVQKRKEETWLLKYVLVPMLIYLVFHSVMWYLGRVSLGLPRMLAVLVPFMALLVVYLFHRLNVILQSKLIINSIAIGFSILVVIKACRYVELPVRLGEEEKVLTEVADYIRTHELQKNKIHYYSLYNEVTLGLDPHYPKQCQQVVHNRANPHEEVRPGSLVIWDSHFAPNEGAMPLENLVSNEHFEILKVFRPAEAFNTLGDRPFEVYLFIRKQD